MREMVRFKVKFSRYNGADRRMDGWKERRTNGKTMCSQSFDGGGGGGGGEK